MTCALSGLSKNAHRLPQLTAAARRTVLVPAGSRSRSATWRHAVHRRAFTTFEINASDSVTIDNRTHIDITVFI